MNQLQLYQPSALARKSPNLLYGIAVLWGIGLIAAIGFLVLYDIDDRDPSHKLYLIPWALLVGGVTLAPAIYLFMKGRLDPFHPLVFPSWSYFFPAFFVGGLLIALGIVEPFYLLFVEDERSNLPLTLFYVSLGYLGIIAGFALPIGKKSGQRIAAWLPEWNWNPASIPLPGLLLLVFGVFNTIFAFSQAIFGFQQVSERGIFDGIISVLPLFWIQANFLLWLYVFRSKAWNSMQFLVIGVLIATSFGRSAFQGSRGGFLQIIIAIAFAYVLSGRKISFKFASIGTSVAVIAIVFGMIYGTTFRQLKGDQEALAFDRYADVVAATFENVGKQDITSSLLFGFSSLSDRVDAVTPLAVVVSNYERHAATEELYGISNNIFTDTAVFFVPRIVWPDKPVGIEPRKYAELYFGFGENSFTITPIGDLLRNFGPLGIPLGMALFGILMRVIYSALHENQPFSFWRATLYYMIVTSVLYEGTYGLILPGIIKTAFVAIAGLLIIRLAIGPGSKVPSTSVAGL